MTGERVKLLVGASAVGLAALGLLLLFAGVEIMSAAHQARIMQKVIARRSASRSVVDETVTSPAQDGVQELRNALGGMGAAMESKRSED